MARGLRIKYLFIAIVAIVLVAVLIKQTGWARNALTWPEIAMREGVAPIQKGLAAAKKSAGGFFSYFTSLRELKAENLQLQEQLEKLTTDLEKFKEYKLENHRLHKLLDIEQIISDSYNLTAANVIARDVSNWTHTIIIDKGSNSGLKKEMAVVSKDGLVGRIWALTPNTAEVRLIVDRDSAVGAMVQDTRVAGVIDGGGEHADLEMIHIPNDAHIEVNQTIITSGLGSSLPKGIRIGYISNVYSDPNGLTKRAVIAPFADFHRLEEVMIILRVKRGE